MRSAVDRKNTQVRERNWHRKQLQKSNDVLERQKALETKLEQQRQAVIEQQNVLESQRKKILQDQRLQEQKQQQELKAKERSEMGSKLAAKDKRIQSLQLQVQEKSTSLQLSIQKGNELWEANDHNIAIIDERNAEIKKHEEMAQTLKDALSAKDQELAAIRQEMQEALSSAAAQVLYSREEIRKAIKGEKESYQKLQHMEERVLTKHSDLQRELDIQKDRHHEKELRLLEEKNGVINQLQEKLVKMQASSALIEQQHTKACKHVASTLRKTKQQLAKASAKAQKYKAQAENATTLLEEEKEKTSHTEAQLAELRMRYSQKSTVADSKTKREQRTREKQTKAFEQARLQVSHLLMAEEKLKKELNESKDAARIANKKLQV
jgi:hypothetical protein